MQFYSTFFHFSSKFTALVFITLISLCSKVALAKPPVQLADVYFEGLDVREYLVSEKYDGIRAIWRDGKLQTRKGNPIHAPNWFVARLPDVWLDGELWSKRQDFAFISSAVSKDKPVDREWVKIRYMVFDAPAEGRTFAQRAEHYARLIHGLAEPHIHAVPQWRVTDAQQLSKTLATYTKAGAEGLMLHRADALYRSGRSDSLLKLKPYMDAEAVVLAHLPGKGKYEGQLGALRVAWKNREGEELIFGIGSGFSDAERASPPPLGSLVTFQYHGLTSYGKPRFASFLRVRSEE